MFGLPEEYKDFTPWIKDGSVSSNAYVLFPVNMVDVVVFDRVLGMEIDEMEKDNIWLHYNDKIKYSVKDYKEISEKDIKVDISEEEEDVKVTISKEGREDLVRVAFRRGWFWILGKIPFSHIYPM